ncbi:hypothetical protein AAEO57_09845 [Flavobacterium sp. DGU38]|uniref:DUF4194 domain-containing protein n=1 Tax=Flavobacterium calami TaxID=3139144 RepID=A0ABU9IQW5_9FLAO
MQENTKELLRANNDIVGLMISIKNIGWTSIREQSIQRTLYLTKVLYSFVSNGENNLFEEYHFSVSIAGPYSELIKRSILDLRVREILIEDSEGNIQIGNKDFQLSGDGNKFKWLKTIVYILGLYGESKIFSFTINDPLYKEAIETNSQKELDTSPENKTVKVLNSFKTAFEETLESVSNISKEEYLELYFEYIFSKIILRD